MVIARSVGVDECVPCLASRKQHCPNVVAETCDDYYLTIPLLDHLIHELHSRFVEGSSLNIAEFVQILPPTIGNSRSLIDRESLQCTCKWLPFQ